MLLTLITMVILTIGIYIAQIPKPDIGYELYNRNNTLHVSLFNVGDATVILTKFDIYNQSNGTKFSLKEETSKELVGASSIFTTNTSITIIKGEKYGIKYCYLWKHEEKCFESGLKYVDNIPSVNLAQEFKLGMSVSIVITRSNGTIEKYGPFS